MSFNALDSMLGKHMFTHWAQTVQWSHMNVCIWVRPTKTSEKRFVNVKFLRQINFIFWA